MKTALILVALATGLLSSSAQPVITVQPTNQSVPIGSNVVFNVTVSGNGPFTYQWQWNGTNLPNRTSLITLAAGNPAASSFSGDGGVATSADLWEPTGVAFDSEGDFYIADTENNRVRRVNTNYVSTTNGPIGIIQTIAGNGTTSYSGDGGQATNAGLNPFSIAVDGLGNVYIADESNNRLRKVDTNGIITTLAGTNIAGFSGDGGQSTNAELHFPTGVAMDNLGDLFIADLENNRIREINTNGIITTVAGTNNAGFSGDGGLAIVAKLASPRAVAVDLSGNLFIAETGNNRIREVRTNGIITTFAGNGTATYAGDGGLATNASLNAPNGVAVDAWDDVFISDSSNNRIRMVDTTGIITTIAGTGGSGSSVTGDGGFATNAIIYEPRNVGLDPYGNPYVSSGSPSIVRKVDLGRTPFLQLNNVGATNAGNYDVVITSSSGSVTSSVVSLTVQSPPAITTQPAGLAAPAGGTATLTVAATNNPAGYQWFTSTGRGALALAEVSGGQVFDIIVIDPGQEYVSTPQVHFVGGGGSGATAAASFLNGIVIGITVENRGSGYAVPPTIQIDPPPVAIAPLPGETNSSLTLSPLTHADWTNYCVVITNSYGSVTSAPVPLVVYLPAQILATQNGTNGGLQLQFTGTPYFTYVLQSTTNLTPPVRWQSIETNYADANGNWSFVVTNLTSPPGAFYRAVGQ
jgi:sugar lactone lactonase YvrE